MQIYLSLVCSSVTTDVCILQLQVYLSWGFICSSVDAVAGIFIIGIGLF